MNLKIDKEKNFLSIIIYGYNNEKNITDFIIRLDEFFNLHFLKYEFIVVNDASDDNTSKVIKSLKLNDNTILSIINMSYHQGLEISMNAGVDLAIGDFIIEIDSLNEDYHFDEFMNCYEKCLSGYDIVAASPDKKSNFFSARFYTIFNHFSSNQYKINSNRFFILSRRAINRIKSLSLNIPYRKAIYSNCGLKYFCYPYKSITNNNKKNTNKENHKIAGTSLILFTSIAYNFSVLLSVLMSFMSVFTVIYTLVIYFNGNPIEGWTTTMIFLSFGFLATFILFSVIIKYLSIILDLQFKKQDYLIESIEKGNK